MAINYSTGEIRSGCRVFHNVDNRPGCPGSAAANSDLVTLTFTVGSSAMVFCEGSIIGAAAGRRDLQFYINGSFLGQCICHTGTASTWDEGYCNGVTTVSAGTYTLQLRSGSANIWGCGGEWGRISALVWEIT